MRSKLKNCFYIFLSITIGLCSMALAGCTKIDEGKEMPYITFGVSSIGESTKGLITNETLSKVYVYGVKNNTEKIFTNAEITKKQQGNNWNISGTPKTWSQGNSYSFYGYSFSGPGTTITIERDSKQNITAVKSEGITITNSALKIEISQPKPTKSDEYALDETKIIDYMLSHAYKVADGSNNHIVMLYMQHAMACVEVNVKKQMSSHTVVLDSLVLENIYTSAIMESESQAIANSGNNNTWKIQLQGKNDVRYRKNFTPSQTTETENNDTPSTNTHLGTMTVLAVPQQLTSSTKLSVHYRVAETAGSSTLTKHTETFNLFNYVPYVWESGHKIKYTLNINTGVELNAQIADWIDAGYTEGVILPSNTQN